MSMLSRNSVAVRQIAGFDAGADGPASKSFSPEDYAAGQVLSGRFRVEHVIGVGSMGVVLAARHIELEKRVAIKLIRSDIQQLPGVVSRFAREAKAAVAIKSAHVAQVFDVGMADNLGPYIVMEYLEGRDLRAVLELEGRLSLRRAVDYVLQACEALAVAHSAGVIHRDIKPENLFLTRQGDLELIKLLDFGISKAALTGRVFGGDLSAEEEACLLGTPLYMSPEQIRAGEVDHRTDIWSLGAVLYELLTARSAFVADTMQELWTRILETAPAPLSAYCPESEAALQGVIDRCLEKDPSRRFRDVAELASALGPFASSAGRLYARRVASILGERSPAESSITASPQPIAPEPQTNALVLSQALAEPGSRAGTSPWERLKRRIAAEARWQRRDFIFVATIGALVLLWLAVRSGATGAQVPASDTAVDAAVTVAVPAVMPALMPEPAPPLAASRTVLVESEPSGAVVEVGGQVIGITPLSTLMPAGTFTLSVSMRGHVSASSVVHVEAAPAGAKPVHTKVVLEPEPSARAGRRRADPGTSDEGATRTRTDPAARVKQWMRASAHTAAPTAATTAATSSREQPERPRLRLVDDPPRARLVD